MKKIVLTMVAGLMAMTMNAQKMYVGGSLGYSTSSYDGSTTQTRVSFVPEFGIMFNEAMGVGVEMGYSAVKNETVDPKLTNSVLKFAPYFRYNALKIGQVSVFADGKFSYSIENDEKNVNGKAEDDKYNTWGIYVQPGIAYNLNDKLSLVAKLGNIMGYTSSKHDVSGAKATTTLQFMNLSNNIQFGVFYNF